MRRGIGRNDPCWCGSGKKYKQCHINRHEDRKLQPWQADKGLQKYYGAKRCMVPDGLKQMCSGNIVRAHTVPKAGSLLRIAADGHVYFFNHSVQRLARTTGILTPELIVINRASTFTGFCSHHDKELFTPIEDVPIVFSTQQCFLLAYRAMAREVFLKQAQLDSMGLLYDADKGLSPKDQVEFQMFASMHGIGVGVGANDAERQRAIYDKTLLSGDYSEVRSYVMTFEQLPPVMCSGGIFPYETFDGTDAQDFADLGTPAQVIHFTSLAAGDLGAVVFTWLPDSDIACDHFVRTLQKVSDSRLSSALVRFFFEYCENILISPSWWDSLDSSIQDALAQRHSEAADPLLERRMDCLLDDGLRIDDWGVHQRYRVGSASDS